MSQLNGCVPPHRFLPYLTAPEIEALPDKANTVIVLPIGAIEQHGPHLPICTDTAIATEVSGKALAALPESVPAFALPPVWCGKSNEHIQFSGTVILKADTLLRVLWDIGESVYRMGFRKLVLVNGHGGQPQVVEIVARDLRAEYPDFCLFPVFTWGVPNRAGEFLSEREKAEGIHAGRAETSLMLALAPDHVHLDRAVGEYPCPHHHGLLTPEGRFRFAWLTHDLSASGVVGDPEGSSREEGETVLASLVEGWVAALEEIHRFRMPVPGSND
ncbi:creatininase family protein [Alloalcanivorax xenomutans]|jgi:creatinine amidohydrolase|uniref:creatininase family protein n=1 Tax=Alloalcanivorax xenomutans TaxID=1094342 RepID=UPI00047B364B|nr:creatininase family protein [Alloalcanivorax xenomutans]MBA4721281.1 creatininase family protein [Alcanivorax sp.]MCE7524539.1 creatininase family protein [Alloalcanivorax xenomutans]CUR46220.1 Creatinine amidohydrolase [Alloalcanivorax xenomutans]